MSKPEQHIVCAALKNKRTGLILCAPRHYDATMRAAIRAIDENDWIDAEQGFVDQYGEFLTRHQARNIVRRTKQCIPKLNRELYSEDLY